MCVFTRQAAVGVAHCVLFNWSNTGRPTGLWLSEDRLVTYSQPAATGGAALGPRGPLIQQTSRWREGERGRTQMEN